MIPIQDALFTTAVVLGGAALAAIVVFIVHTATGNRR